MITGNDCFENIHSPTIEEQEKITEKLLHQLTDVLLENSY